MNEKPNYYSILPADVRYDNTLRPNEKILYSEITALTQKDGECWASNNYFAELYGVKENAVATWIKHLKDKEYISIDYKYKNNSKEIEKRIIKIGGIQKDTRWYSKRYQGGIQKGEDNNTSINNNKENNISKDIFKRKYFENDKLNTLFIEFLEQRKKLKAINSERAIKQLLEKLELYDDLTKEQMIEESLVNSWKSVFPIKHKKENKKEEWWNKYEN